MTSLVGKTIGPCQVESLLGEGSSGQLYRAQHARLQTPVALKVLAPRYGSNERALVRFRREAQTAARISHPAVARVLDLGEAEGRPFIVQELVAGENLETRIERAGALDGEAGIDLALQLAGGLMAIHAAGLLHRDLKPANIILTDAGAKIVDFGLAKDLLDDGDDPAVTRPGIMLGTPLYMAPEQVQGQDLTPAADWYGLGGVLRFALTGEPPHGHGSGDVGEFLVRRASEPVPPLERNSVPEAFATLVDGLLATEPEERPGGDHVHRALLALRRARRPLPPPPGKKPPLAALWILSGLIVLLLVVALAAALQTTNPTAPPAPTVDPPKPEPLRPEPPKPEAPKPEAPKPEPPKPEPPKPEPTPAREPRATLDDVLAQLGALDFDGARASLAKLEADTPQEEVNAARVLLRLLEGINSDGPLKREYVPTPGTIESAPQTRAVFRGFAMAGLPVYIQARLNLENGNPRGVREVLLNAPPTLGDAPFLEPKRRSEITLIKRVATIQGLLEVDRPQKARENLIELLAHPSAQTAFGRRATPFLEAWLEQMDRALGPR